MRGNKMIGNFIKYYVVICALFTVMVFATIPMAWFLYWKIGLPDHESMLVIFRTCVIMWVFAIPIAFTFLKCKD
jgi:hypothetical protein